MRVEQVIWRPRDIFCRLGASFFIAVLGLTGHFFASTAEANSLLVRAPVSVAWRLDAETFELIIGGRPDLQYRVDRGSFLSKVVVDVESEVGAHQPRAIPLDDVAIQRIRVNEGPLGTRIVIDLNYPLPSPVVSRTAEGLVITLSKRFRRVDETYVAPGLWFGQVKAGEVYGPVSVKYLRVDLNRPGVRVYPALAGDVFGLAPVSSVVQRSGAMAAVNGGFYHWSGRPLGLLIQDGRLISEDIYGRTAFGLREDGTPFIAPIEVEMWIEAGEGVKIPVEGINRPRMRGEAVVYTSHYGRLPARKGHRMYIHRGFVVSGAEWRQAPDDGMVVEYDADDPRFAGVGVGEALRFAYRVVPEDVGPVLFALGGGPRLLSDGHVSITGEKERFQPDVLRGRAPRTAVGIEEDGRLLIVVVDGRERGYSHGMTLEELASFMKELGAVTAMNLDGGNSSTLVLKGWVLNQPSGGRERAVASALVVDVEIEGL